MIPALLQIAPALGGVAEIEGARGARSRRVIRRTLSFIERNNKFSRRKLEAIAGNSPLKSVQICFHISNCKTNLLKLALGQEKLDIYGSGTELNLSKPSATNNGHLF